jgi:hypothetical protein
MRDPLIYVVVFLAFLYALFVSSQHEPIELLKKFGVYILNQSLVAWIAALGTIAVAAIALFKDIWKGIYYRPIIEIIYNDNRPWNNCKKQIDGQELSIKIQLVNIGRSTANNVSCRIMAAYVYEDEGKAYYYAPAILKYDNAGDEIVANLYPNSPVFITLLRINENIGEFSQSMGYEWSFGTNLNSTFYRTGNYNCEIPFEFILEIVADEISHSYKYICRCDWNNNQTELFPCEKDWAFTIKPIKNGKEINVDLAKHDIFIIYDKFLGKWWPRRVDMQSNKRSDYLKDHFEIYTSSTRNH